MDKLRFFYRYTDLNTMQDVGAALIGRLKGYFPAVSSLAVEMGAYTIIFTKYHINIPWWLLLGVLVGKQYVWIVVYYFSGLAIRKTGLLRAQNEYMEREEDLDPVQVQVNKTLENIAAAVGAESGFSKYQGVKLKEIPKEFKK